MGMTEHTDAHAELVGRDRALPGLGMLFDPARLAHVLETHSGVTVSSIEPVYIRYKAQTNCLVGYRINGPMGDAYVYAKAFRPDAGDKPEKASAVGACATWLGPGPLLLRDSAVTIWAHPNDGKLRTLRHLADDDGRQILLRRAPDDVRDSLGMAFRPLSYKPERRFVAELRPRDPAAPRRILKMYTGAGYEQALVRATGIRSRDVLQVPARLARDRRRHLLFLDWLPGRLAADLVSSDEPLEGQMALVGAALAELHDQPVNPTMVSSLPYDTATLVKVLAGVASILPKLAPALTRLSERLRGMSPTPGHPVSPVHGDFHLRQILISTPTVGFVDFDRAGAGPALGDLACCRAHVEWDVLAGALSRGRADDVIEELLAGYARLRERPSSPDLDACTAAALTLLLPEPFRHFRPDAFDLTARILDRALALLTRAAARPSLA